MASESDAPTAHPPQPHQGNGPIQSPTTDSMVTIRLSEPVSTPDLASGHEFPNDRDIIIEPPRTPSRPSSLDMMHGQISESPIEYSSPDGAVATSPRNSPQPHDSTHLSEPRQGPSHSRSNSTSSVRSDVSAVDWSTLDKTEEQESKDEASDDATAFLLARLEQENNSLATDPRFGGLRKRSGARPPSIAVLKKLVNDPIAAPARYSLLSNRPPMTELEFWAALVKDYPQTAQRLPTLTTNKIRGGVPPPLRGVVWVSMCGARDGVLEEEYHRLCLETSPYENLIGKDIGRSFPGVEMFRDPEGDGQKMLGLVLKAFSLYDRKIGYCQGLGFLVGPLLMQMGDKDAFCVLVRLMENYGLRSCFLPDLSGLHLRIYQFQQLLTEHMPEVAAHLTELQIEPAYLSKWFLSFFAITCPLPMLFRIYDVIFAEGAAETMMRVALSLMRCNETRIMASNEFEEVIQLLLGRALWEPYNHNADDLVNDFMRYSPGGATDDADLTSLVTRERLQALETAFKEAHPSDPATRAGIFPDVSAAASRFLGRLWTSTTLKPSLSPATPSRPTSMLHRTPSKMSIATINSADVSSESTGSTASSSASTQMTETTLTSRESTTDLASIQSLKSKPESIAPNQSTLSKEDKDLYGQIEDLLTALTESQRDQAMMATQLQREREERSEDHRAFRALLAQLQSRWVPAVDKDRRKTALGLEIAQEGQMMSLYENLGSVVERVDERLSAYGDERRSSILETKQRLRESLVRSKEQAQIEAKRARELSRQVEEQEQELKNTRDDLREARARLQESHAERQKLERTVQELRAQPSSRWGGDSPVEPPSLARTDTSDSWMSRSSVSSMGPGGLRELKLPQRSTSLMTHGMFGDEHHPNNPDDLLVKLVNAKTAEATAKQDLEEARGKLEAMRRLLGMPSPPPTSLHRPSPSDVTIVGMETPASQPMEANAEPKPEPKPELKSASTFTAGFWGWGKRSASTNSATAK